ncbi:unnamed protein product [Rotaria sp. Silwood2]|nr:unnamed protein product [Rotaria sp. Silwood2]
MCINNPIYLPSTEDIQQTFIDFPNEIISYVYYLLEFREGRCHIYSYPSLMLYYGDITNNFPGGLFEYVRVVAHDDYVEQFLLNTRTSLPNNVSLYINYKSLERVTHNFTRDATRINSTKINYLNLRAQNEYFNLSLKEYFPHAKIFSSIMFWIPEQ